MKKLLLVSILVLAFLLVGCGSQEEMSDEEFAEELDGLSDEEFDAVFEEDESAIAGQAVLTRSPRVSALRSRVRSTVQWDCVENADGIVWKYTTSSGRSREYVRSDACRDTTLFSYSCVNNRPKLARELCEFGCENAVCSEPIPAGDEQEFEEVDDFTEISACTSLTAQRGKYRLTQDVSIEEFRNCFLITHTGITLDCNGHKIISSDNQGDSGIKIAAGSAKIHNCHIEGFEHGILAQSGGSSKIIDNTILVSGRSRSGIRLNNAMNIEVRGNTVEGYSSTERTSAPYAFVGKGENNVFVSNRAINGGTKSLSCTGSLGGPTTYFSEFSGNELGGFVCSGYWSPSALQERNSQ